MGLKFEKINVKTKKLLVDILDPKLRSINVKTYLAVGDESINLNYNKTKCEKKLKKLRQFVAKKCKHTMYISNALSQKKLLKMHLKAVITYRDH